MACSGRRLTSHSNSILQAREQRFRAFLSVFISP
jgi:hypothetical protein